MILALTATLAIVVQDHTMLRAAPRSNGTELAALTQGDALEVRGEQAEYLSVYDYRRERGGYLRGDTVHQVQLTESGARDLLTVLRFLRDTPGSESLGISYGAAYLKAVPSRALTAEPFDAIAVMAERLADRASSGTWRGADAAAHLDAVQQFGVRMLNIDHNGRMQLCYDGDLYRRVLSQSGASAEQRARAALGLTRADCIDPNLSPIARASRDDERRKLLDATEDVELSPLTRSRIHARRAAVWASVAFEQARRGAQPNAAATRAAAELLDIRPNDLGDDRRDEYLEALLRVGAIRWATQTPAPQVGPIILDAAAGDQGQTCVSLRDAHRPAPGAPGYGAPGDRAPGYGAPLLRRCTYGIVWMASVLAITPAPAVVLAVQPMDGWCELWVFHKRSEAWTVDVLSPGTEDPELGYIEFAGFAADSRRLLIAREVEVHGRIQRRFEALRLDDLTLERQASTPDLLRDFRRSQNASWRRDTLSLH